MTGLPPPSSFLPCHPNRRSHEPLQAVLRGHLRHQTRKLEAGWLGDLRGELLAGVRGRIVEIGGGTGANLGHYATTVELTVTETDPAMMRRLERKVRRAGAADPGAAGPGRGSPLRRRHVRRGRSTLVLCGVADQPRALPRDAPGGAPRRRAAVHRARPGSRPGTVAATGPHELAEPPGRPLRLQPLDARHEWAGRLRGGPRPSPVRHRGAVVHQPVGGAGPRLPSPPRTTPRSRRRPKPEPRPTTRKQEERPCPRCPGRPRGRCRTSAPPRTRTEELDGYTTQFVSIRQTHDLAEVLSGLPGGHCRCPHWGYLVAGRDDRPLRRPRRGDRGR